MELTSMYSSLDGHIIHDINIDEKKVEINLKSCTKNKSCGPDNVYYEHILHG